MANTRIIQTTTTSTNDATNQAIVIQPNFCERSVQTTTTETKLRIQQLCTCEEIRGFTRLIKAREIMNVESIEIGNVHPDMIKLIELLFYHLLLKGFNLTSISFQTPNFAPKLLSIPIFSNLNSVYMKGIDLNSRTQLSQLRSETEPICGYSGYFIILKDNTIIRIGTPKDQSTTMQPQSKLYTHEEIKELINLIKTTNQKIELQSIEIGDVDHYMINAIEQLFYHILLRDIHITTLSFGNLSCETALLIPTFHSLKSLRIGYTNIGTRIEILDQPELTSFEIGRVHPFSTLVINNPFTKLTSVSYDQFYNGYLNNNNENTNAMLEFLDRLASTNAFILSKQVTENSDSDNKLVSETELAELNLEVQHLNL